MGKNLDYLKELADLYSNLKKAPEDGEKKITINNAHELYPVDSTSNDKVLVDPISDFVKDLGLEITEKGKTR